MGALGAAAVAVTTVLVLNATVAEVRRIPSDSMDPTLAVGERVLVRKAGVDRLGLEPGTLVVFDAADLWVPPDDPAGTVFVKRIVAVGGDEVTCCDDSGRILRNGVPLPAWPGVREPSDGVPFHVAVMPGHYWMLGDNRPSSADSRAHLGDPGGGNIPASRIIGVVSAVVWPPAAAREVRTADE